MDTRDKIGNRKGKIEESSNRKKETNDGKALFTRKDKVIRLNDIIVCPFANKIKLDEGENSNPVKQEEREEEGVRREEGVEVVTVEEQVELYEEPCVEQDGNAEMGHSLEVPSAMPTVREAGPSSQPMGISLDSTAAPIPLQETVNYLVRLVGSMGTELEKVKEKLSMGSLPASPHPSTENPNDMEASPGEDKHLDVDTESSLGTADETGSKHCLVCYKDVPSSSDDTPDDCALIDKQLQGIYFLNKLLCIPPTTLAKYLETYPDENPASWISLCGDCRKVVQKACRIHDEIVNASRKLKRIQEMVINKIKLSTIGTHETSASQVTSRDVGSVVTQESRRYVSEHEYGHFVDPFPQGDWEACRLLTESKRKSEAEQSAKSKRTKQIDAEVVAPEVDNTRQKNRKTKSRNMISRKKNPQKRRIDEEGTFFREDEKISYRGQIGGCSKMYTTAQNNGAHKLKQSGKKTKYSCDQCDKVLTSRSGLYYHKKGIHERNFKHRENKKRRLEQLQRKCPHCDLITDKYHLATHIKRVHEKAFAVNCEICGNRYNQRNELKRHQADRHGICSVEQCKLEFPGDRRGLRNHQLQAHGREINVFGCEVCGKLFTQASSLREHQWNFHASQRS